MAELIQDMPEQAYHDETGLGEGLFITRSMINCYADTKRGFRLRYVDKHPQAQFAGNKGTSFGSIVDALLAGTFDSTYAVRPEGVDWRTKEGKAILAELKESGLEIVTHEDHSRALLCLDGLNEHGLGRDILASASGQGWVIRWEDENGLPLQVRLDALVQGVALVDYKTTSKPFDQFIQSAEAFGYATQAIMYADAWEKLTGENRKMLFAIMRSSFPFDADVQWLPQMMLDYHRKRYDAAREGIAAGDFSDNRNEATEAVIPAWALYLYEEAA
jgi:hypothetical protein